MLLLPAPGVQMRPVPGCIDINSCGSKKRRSAGPVLVFSLELVPCAFQFSPLLVRVSLIVVLPDRFDIHSAVSISARSNGTRNSVAYADKSGTGWRNCRGNRPKMPHTDVGVVSHRRHPRQSALGLAEGHNALFYLESQPAPLRLCYKNGPFVSSGPPEPVRRLR